MSIENRLEAKKRSQKARRRATVAKVVKIVLIIMIPVIICGIAFGIYWSKESKKIEYSKYLTADGDIEGYSIDDNLTLADYTNMGIKLDDYQPTDEEITTKVESLVTTAVKAEAEKTEDTEDDTAEVDVDAVLTDAWVEANYKEQLGTTYDHTVDGFKAYAKQSLYDANVASIQNDISSYLNDNSKLKEYPKKYTRNLIQIYKNEAEKLFTEYADTYAYYGYTTVYDQYGGKKEFKEQMETNAKSEVKSTIILLKIYEKLGLTYTEADMKTYFTDEKGQVYDEILKEYGKAYLITQYKCAKALDALEDTIK